MWWILLFSIVVLLIFVWLLASLILDLLVSQQRLNFLFWLIKVDDTEALLCLTERVGERLASAKSLVWRNPCLAVLELIRLEKDWEIFFTLNSRNTTKSG